MAGTDAVPNQRTRQVYAKAEGDQSLISDARWPVWAALMLYQILDVVNATTTMCSGNVPYVPRMQQIRTLPVAWTIAGADNRVGVREEKKIRTESHLSPTSCAFIICYRSISSSWRGG